MSLSDSEKRVSCPGCLLCKPLQRPMEPTTEQGRKLFDALNHLGMSEWRGKTIEVLWPLIRDMVIDECARACEERELNMVGDRCARLLRTLKGKPAEQGYAATVTVQGAHAPSVHLGASKPDSKP